MLQTLNDEKQKYFIFKLSKYISVYNDLLNTAYEMFHTHKMQKKDEILLQQSNFPKPLTLLVSRTAFS